MFDHVDHSLIPLLVSDVEVDSFGPELVELA
jgi:hypothetical protein